MVFVGLMESRSSLSHVWACDGWNFKRGSMDSVRLMLGGGRSEELPQRASEGARGEEQVYHSCRRDDAINKRCSTLHHPVCCLSCSLLLVLLCVLARDESMCRVRIPPRRETISGDIRSPRACNMRSCVLMTQLFDRLLLSALCTTRQ
jgi:hypothetical protein